MFNCFFNDGKYNKLFVNGYFKINSCLMEYLMIFVSDKIGNRCRNNLIWFEGYRMCWLMKKKGVLEM